jgi:hypothetical protein
MRHVATATAPAFGTWLLYALMAGGVVFVGVGAALPHVRLFASGIWLVALAMLVRLLLSLAPPL